MPVNISLTALLLVFLGGFLLHRHVSVRIAAVTGLVLGVLLAGGWWGTVVHTLDGVFRSLT
jgi:hypothetical protein